MPEQQKEVVNRNEESPMRRVRSCVNEDESTLVQVCSLPLPFAMSIDVSVIGNTSKENGLVGEGMGIGSCWRTGVYQPSSSMLIPSLGESASKCPFQQA